MEVGVDDSVPFAQTIFAEEGGRRCDACVVDDDVDVVEEFEDFGGGGFHFVVVGCVAFDGGVLAAEFFDFGHGFFPAVKVSAENCDVGAALGEGLRDAAADAAVAASDDDVFAGYVVCGFHIGDGWVFDDHFFASFLYLNVIAIISVWFAVVKLPLLQFTPGEVDVYFASDRVASKRSGANMRMDAHLSDKEAKKRLPSARV